MMRVTRFIWALGVVLLALASPAVFSGETGAIGLPEHGRIQFAVSRGEPGILVGRTTNEWQHDRGSYSIKSVSEAAGVLALFVSKKSTQTSEGAITAAGLVPHRFRSDRGGNVDTATFDWKADRVSLSSGDSRQAPLVAGAQDALSIFYQMGLLPPGALTSDILVATGRKVDHYAFDVLGEERATFPFGTHRLLHLRTRGTAGDNTTEIWLALDMARLPLKIRFTDRKGDTYVQMAEQVDLAGAVAAK
jgi:hypothetical protein